MKKWGSNMCGGLYDLNDLLKLLTVILIKYFDAVLWNWVTARKDMMDIWPVKNMRRQRSRLENCFKNLRF